MNDKVNVCLEIPESRNLYRKYQRVMGGILVVYRNFQNCLIIQSETLFDRFAQSQNLRRQFLENFAHDSSEKLCC